MTGTVTVSLDFEVGWGAIETGFWKARQQKGVYTQLRPVMQRLTQQLDRLEMSLTWATVGAMICDPKPSDFDYLSNPHAQAARKFLEEADTATTDGRDLYEMVANCKTRQDIGSHTFSHTRFSIEHFSADQKNIDIAKSVSVMKSWGITPKSFVFPLNHSSDHDVLATNGFEVSRIAPSEPRDRFGKLVKRMLGRANTAERKTLLPDYALENGSLLYNWSTARNWRLRRALTERQIAQSLKRLEQGNYHLHVWLHPFNLAEVPGLEDGFTRFLRHVATLRDAGKIDVKPMTPSVGSDTLSG